VFLLPSSVAFGWVYQQASPARAFALAGGCAIAAAALLALWVPRASLDLGNEAA